MHDVRHSDVECDDALCGWDAQLFVRGSVKVKGLLATYLTDAGHFVVKGGLAAAN